MKSINKSLLPPPPARLVTGGYYNQSSDDENLQNLLPGELRQVIMYVYEFILHVIFFVLNGSVRTMLKLCVSLSGFSIRRELGDIRILPDPIRPAALSVPPTSPMSETSMLMTLVLQTSLPVLASWCSHCQPLLAPCVD